MKPDRPIGVSEFFKPKKLSGISFNQSTIDGLMPEKGLHHQFSFQYEDFDESLGNTLDLYSKHRLVARELIFQSKFDTSIKKPNKETETFAQIDGPAKCVDPNQFADPKLSQSDQCGISAPIAKIISPELDFLGSEQNELIFCATPGTTNVNSEGPTIGRLRNSQLISSPQSHSNRSPQNYEDVIFNGNQSADVLNLERPVIEQANQTSNINDLRIEVAANQNNQEASHQINFLTLSSFSEFESKLYLRRTIVYFAIMAIFSLILIFVLRGEIPIQSLFGPFYFYWIYFVVDSIIAAKNLQREEWRRKDDLFRIFQGITALLIQAWLHLRLNNIIPFSPAACAPFAIITVIYCFTKNRPPFQLFCLNISVQVASTIQILLITLKIDNIIDWEWRIVLTMIWFSLLSLCFFFVLFGLAAIGYTFMYIFRQYFAGNVDFKAPIIGSFWYFMYYSIGPLGILCYYGLDEQLNSEEISAFIKYFSWISFCVNSFNVIFTILAFEFVKKYIKTHINSIASNDFELINVEKENISVSFHEEQKEVYFEMISPTYFLPLGHKSNIQKNNKIPQEVKSKQNYGQTCELASVRLNFEEDKNALDKKNTQKQDKELARRWSEIPTSKNQIEGNSIEVNFMSYEQKKFNLTEIEQVFESKFQKNVDRSNNICFVCFHNVADIILMNCGHGGLCYECAKASIQRKNECVSCRRKINSLYKINPKFKFGSITKSVQRIKIIES